MAKGKARGPDFLCVGMPKCGTSTLHAILHDYSDIYVPPVKEIKFFAAKQMGYGGSTRALLFDDHWAAKQERRAVMRIARQVLTRRAPAKDLAWAARFVFSKRDLNWYRGLFPQDRVSGDLSPAYHMLERDEIEAIARELPDLKIIIMLRNPYQQMWSHCRMSSRGKTLEDELKFFKEQVEYQLGLSASYQQLISNWADVFGTENVMVEYLENMQKGAPDFARKIIGFVDPTPGADAGLQSLSSDYQVFAGKKIDMPPGVHAVLYEAAKTRLEGFESVDQDQAKIWRQELAEINERMAETA